jgi:hypothetical protein
VRSSRSVLPLRSVRAYVLFAHLREARTFCVIELDRITLVAPGSSYSRLGGSSMQVP